MLSMVLTIKWNILSFFFNKIPVKKLRLHTVKQTLFLQSIPQTNYKFNGHIFNILQFIELTTHSFKILISPFYTFSQSDVSHETKVIQNTKLETHK